MIIGISGKGRAGKDTLARTLCQVWPGSTIAFADPLRTIVSTLYGPEVVSRRTPTYRWAMQTIGHTLREIDPSIWLWPFLRRYQSGHFGAHDLVYIPDVRYPDEADCIHALGGVVIRLEVSDATRRARGMEPSRMAHLSETALDDYPRFDLRISADRSELAVHDYVVAFLCGAGGLTIPPIVG